MTDKTDKKAPEYQKKIPTVSAKFAAIVTTTLCGYGNITAINACRAVNWALAVCKNDRISIDWEGCIAYLQELGVSGRDFMNEVTQKKDKGKYEHIWDLLGIS